MNITLHIERLVLDGLDLSRAEAEKVKEGLKAELTRLLSDGQLAPHLLGGGSYPDLKTDGLRDVAVTPKDLGRHAAGSVYGSLGKTG